MTEDLQHDKRQIEKMLAVIDAYLNKQVSLSDLVGTLSFLVEWLNTVSDEWLTTFNDTWMHLD